LQWGSFTQDDILIGPGAESSINSFNYKKIIFSSRELEDNLIQHSVNEKKSIKLNTKVCELYFKNILETNVGTL
jgi:hypothetical protein